MFSICVIVILATKTLFEEHQFKTLQKQKQKTHLFYSFALEVVCTSTSLRRQYKQTDPIAQG